MARGKHPIHDRLMAFDMSRSRFLPDGFVADILKDASEGKVASYGDLLAQQRRRGKGIFNRVDQQ